MVTKKKLALVFLLGWWESFKKNPTAHLTSFTIGASSVLIYMIYLRLR